MDAKLQNVLSEFSVKTQVCHICLERHKFKKVYRSENLLTLKVPITTAVEDIHKYFFIVFQRK